VRRFTTGLSPCDVLASVTGVAPPSVETKWWSVTSGMATCGERPERLDGYDGYDGGAAKYAGRGVPSVNTGMGSPSCPTSLPFCRFHLSNHRKTRNAMRIPTAIPPSTPPTIAPVLGEALLLSVTAIEVDPVKESLAMLIELETTRKEIGSVLLRVVIPATVV
jgi:hypothetical protein